MKRISQFAAIFFLISILFILGCKKNDNLGKIENPIVISFMPSKDNAGVDQLSLALKAFLEKDLKIAVITKVSKNYISIIEDFENFKVHISFINTFGYLLAHYWGDANAEFSLIFSSGRSSYQGQIVVHSDSKITSVKDLTGLKFAYKDPYSTAGFILPLKYLTDNNIKPEKTVFLKTYYNILLGVYNRKVDAGAIYYDAPVNKGIINDARKEILKKYPDAGKKLKLLTSTGEIKSSPIAFHKKISGKLKLKLIDSIKRFALTEEGKISLKAAYDAIGLEKSSNKDYEKTRKMINSIGREAEELIPEGKKLILRKKLDKLKSRFDNNY